MKGHRQNRGFPTAVKELESLLRKTAEGVAEDSDGRFNAVELHRSATNEQLGFLNRLNAHPDAVSMWRSLERWERKRNSKNLESTWPFEFLRTVIGLSSAAPYTTLPKSERYRKAEKIRHLSNDLIEEIAGLGLDVTIIGIAMQISKGRYFGEDFGQPGQAHVIKIGDSIAATDLIRAICGQAVEDLTDTSLSGTKKAIIEVKFIRHLCDRNKQRYGQSLNEVVATATNAIFGTKYDASQVAQLAIYRVK